MVDVGPLSASVPDVIRLLTIPFFAALAWRDIKTRRVPSIYWAPLTLIGLVLLWFDWQQAADLGGFNWEMFIISTGVGIGLLVPFAFLFWAIGGFGGADARAILVISILYPVYPKITIQQTLFPLIQSPLPVFSFTILSNAVICGILYPLGLGLRNVISGTIDKKILVGLKIHVSDLEKTYGKMMNQPKYENIFQYIKVIAVPRKRGLDLDALRMYLRWRGLSLTELRNDPSRYRDPESIPAETNPPTDGAVNLADTDSNHSGQPALENEDNESGHKLSESGNGSSDTEAYDDPWGADMFLESTYAYGTTPEALRHGLDHITESEEVWITPGIPFLVPIFFGILAAFVYGDIVVSIMQLLGVL